MTGAASEDRPDWLFVGATVATLAKPRNQWQLAVATVDRIGKRDVVLSDGQRFPVSKLVRFDGGSWGWSVNLLPTNDPAVLAARRQIEHSRMVDVARIACEKFIRGSGNAFDTILALAPLTGVAAEIAALDGDSR